ncbi:MAG: hypothetical protein CME40_05940 [Haliea sp.]|nr:hypothetical protein [Haliea sp.]|tara:strand:+ start:24664 stop:26022 length:1359 start_codon:yes stop_codon:yes gene_type:complete
MSERKSRREIDKAIKHLMAYTGPNQEWEGRWEQVQAELLEPLAGKLEVSAEELEEFFYSGPYSHMVIGFGFEDYATAVWDNEARNLIEAYLAHRGWREGSAGRQYLRALGESELGFWEITAVKPGAYAEIRPYGTQDEPIRVKEKAATESLHRWDGLVARVLQSGRTRTFSGAMLPLRPELAARVQRVLSAIPEETRGLMQQLLEQGEIESIPEDLEDVVRQAQASELAGVAFTVWAMDVYLQTTRPAPILQNRDAESIVPTRVRFPVGSAHDDIIRALDTSPVLRRELDATSWTWFPKPCADVDADQAVSVLGHIALHETTLELDTNSIERAERGAALLGTLLGDLVGAPLTVHENLASMAGRSDVPVSNADRPEEAQAALEDQLTRHYRNTLDEPIPMLNGLSPRQCAADPARRGDVIGWLKYLENAGDRGPGIPYDFSWMWDELNLERE